MYILSSGKIASNNKQRLSDIINLNMSLDICDVPLAKYGIVQNFSKQTLFETLMFLKLMTVEFLDGNNIEGLSFEEVRYDKGKFTIVFNYNGSEILVNLDSEKLYE